MKYIILLILLFFAGFPAIQAQNEKKITIVPFRPPQKTKRPNASSKRAQGKPVPKKRTLDKDAAAKADTVDDYLKRNSQPRMAPSSSSGYIATVPGYIDGERSRYQKGETQSSTRNIPFTFRPQDKLNGDPRNLPVVPGKAGGDYERSGMAIGVDMNQALAMAFSKKARLRSRNAKKRLWEKYPKVSPNDSLVKQLNNKPDKMLSVKQQQDSLLQKTDSALKIKAPVSDKYGRQKNGNRGAGLSLP